MSQTKTTAISYNTILRKAKSGEYKLPAFQRKWRWTTRQVMSLYESLRLGYPIGAFLFLSSAEGEKLGPRAFHGAGKRASSHPGLETLILDGQQRITAGMSIYYGLDDVDGSEYYIDYRRVEELLRAWKINIDDEDSLLEFKDRIDLEDRYLVAKRRREDRKSYFHKSDLIWTALLTDERHGDLDDLLDSVNDKRKKDVIRKVIRAHLRPNTNIQVPAIELGGEFDLAAISKVFSTINSTGKALTPFELVVAILYPNGIRLEDDVENFKSKFRFYRNMDKNGEILLQCISLLSRKSPKKSDLPKNIDHTNYGEYSEVAAECLNDLGEFLSQHLGVGLDVTDRLTPYDAVFAPMALAYRYVKSLNFSQAELGSAKRKLCRWFVASAVAQRYQEGVHNKQTSDLSDIKFWIDDDTRLPGWIKAATATPSIKYASPNGAIGRLMLCLINSASPKDPVQLGAIGFKDGCPVTEVHHIFPTRWVSKGIKDYDKRMDTNLALNAMMLSAETNGDWLNFDPKSQVEQAAKVAKKSLADIYSVQLVGDEGLDILRKSEKFVEDYENFIEHRYKMFLRKLQEFDIGESSNNEEVVELDEPSIVED